MGPGDVDALLVEAQRAAAEERYTDALRALRAAARVAPEDPEVFTLLGAVALRADRPAESEAALARAVELAPRDARALSAYGLALRAQRRYDEAEAALLRSLILRPADPSTLAALGEVYRLSGQPEKCADRYEQFVWQLEREEAEAGSDLQQRVLDTSRERMRECEAAAAARETR